MSSLQHYQVNRLIVCKNKHALAPHIHPIKSFIHGKDKEIYIYIYIYIYKEREREKGPKG